MIITNNTTINLSFLKKEDFQFKFDSEFDATDTFKLQVGDITNENYGFTADGDLTFARVDFSSLTNNSNTLTYKVYKNNVQIATGTVIVNLEDGGLPSGVIFNNVQNIATEVKVTIDTSEITDFSNMFYQCGQLTTVPLFDTSSATAINNMFYYAVNLVNLPNFDFSSVRGATYSFASCSKLVDVTNITFGPFTTAQYLFNNCYALEKVPALNFGNVASQGAMNNVFQNCSKLTHFGGLQNVKFSYSLSSSPLLTHDSLINCINGLTDLTGETAQTLTLGDTNLAKLTEQEIALATAKNWILN